MVCSLLIQRRIPETWVGIFLQTKNITTIIDMRGQKDVDRKP